MIQKEKGDTLQKGKVSRVSPTPNITNHFGAESFQAIHCTATDKLQVANEIMQATYKTILELHMDSFIRIKNEVQHRKYNSMQKHTSFGWQSAYIATLSARSGTV